MLTSKKDTEKIIENKTKKKNNKGPQSLKILTERSNSAKWKCPLKFLSRPKVSGRLPSSQRVKNGIKSMSDREWLDFRSITSNCF
jgi:hypothetical protein